MRVKPEGGAPAPRRGSPDVLVVGAGLVGLACAAALARRGARVTVVGLRRPGEASPAAAGMLAPGVEQSGANAAHRFAVAARDRYPAYVAQLADETSIDVPLLRNGILEVALDEGAAADMRASAPARVPWLEPRDLRALEPALSHAAGALHHPDDGAVDNVRLLEALEAVVDRHPAVSVVRETVLAVEPGAESVAVRAENGRVEADRVVLAAGAWVSGIAGLPLALPVEPVRGQMLAYEAMPLRHVVYGRSSAGDVAHGYLVPRGTRTLAGSTMERVGFDSSTTSAAQAEIETAVRAICPALAAYPVQSTWSGLRPVTPDLLPIIGPDPRWAGLLYACGHSRNGILMAPLTGDCIAALALGESPGFDLSPFAPDRFPDEAGRER